MGSGGGGGIDWNPMHSSVGTAVSQGASTLGNNISNGAQALGNNLAQGSQALGNNIGQGIQQTSNNISQGLNRAGSSIGGTFGQGLQQMGNNIEGAGKTAGENIAAGGKQLGNNINIGMDTTRTNADFKNMNLNPADSALGHLQQQDWDPSHSSLNTGAGMFYGPDNGNKQTTPSALAAGGGSPGGGAPMAGGMGFGYRNPSRDTSGSDAFRASYLSALKPETAFTFNAQNPSTFGGGSSKPGGR
jgi:hypothetical protein